jgi:endonuclease III
MANPNRTALLTKAHRILKQHYKPVAPAGERPLLEQMLYACCLENAPFESAEKVYDHLHRAFFDWNEVRVSTLSELTEAMHNLPDPPASASNLKRILQAVFESTYSFEIDAIKKQNLGQAIKQLEKLGGASPFVVAYVTQAALGGHSIPLDRGALEVLYLLGVISQNESQTGKVSGLERIIPKNKGVEFGSLLHQLAADYVANPFSPNVRKLILSINSDAKDRFPKRGAKKEPAKPPEPVPPPAVKGKGQPHKPAEAGATKSGDKQREKHVAKPDEKKKSAAKVPAARSGAAKPHPVSAKRKPPAKQIAKRKPR